MNPLSGKPWNPIPGEVCRRLSSPSTGIPPPSRPCWRSCGNSVPGGGRGSGLPAAAAGGAAAGKRFLLQGGDCAEAFADCRGSIIQDKLRVLLQMSVLITHGAARA